MNNSTNLKYIFDCLTVLRECDMNKSAAALKLNTTRLTLRKYYNTHWTEFIAANPQQESVKPTSITFSDGNDIELVKQDTITAYRLALKHITERLQDKVKPMPDYVVLDFMKNIAPYVLPKPGDESPKEPGDKLPYEDFIAVFQRKMIEIENL
jgi:hypothetical protein